MELSEYRMDLPQKKGNGTSSASLGEHLTKQKDLSWHFSTMTQEFKRGSK